MATAVSRSVAALGGLCLFFFQAAVAQPILDRKITVVVQQEPLPRALTKIAEAGQFTFSYNAALVSDKELVSLQAQSRPVREVLNALFKGTFTYKEKGNYVILTKVSVKQPKTSAVTTVLVSGYVEDAATQLRLSNVSVYEKRSLASATTDSEGFFKLQLQKTSEPIQVSFNKREYQDTVLVLTETGPQYVLLSLRPMVQASSQDVAADSARVQDDELVLPFDREPNVMNIRDTLYRDIQASILPFVGTNGRLSGNVINDYSVNFFGGYSLGTRQIELGFFVNIDRGDVSWLQIAGFGNLVGRNVYGVQAAGFANVNGGETKAVQVAGFANTNQGNARGVQVAGFSNVNLRQADGVLVAGFVNFVRGESFGMQVAGFGNVQTAPYRGSQVAGFFNFNQREILGSQVAGFSNIATDSVWGSQVATVFNYGGHVRGSQIGLINYAKSVRGAPIGLLSFVKNGYHKIEVAADEAFYTNLAFRTGVRKFYNIVFAGIQPTTQQGDNVWTFGYGLGSARKLNRWVHLNLDVTAQHVNQGKFTEHLSLLNKAHTGFDIHFAPKFSLYLGATLNGYLTKTNFDGYPELFRDWQPNIFHDEPIQSGSTRLQMWVGWKAGLRFL
jgi:hypothetical protein